MKAYTLTTEGLTQTGNQFKEVFLDKMLSEDVISQEQKDKMSQYSMVVSEKGFFGKLWDKIYKNEDTTTITVVKIIE